MYAKTYFIAALVPALAVLAQEVSPVTEGDAAAVPSTASGPVVEPTEGGLDSLLSSATDAVSGAVSSATESASSAVESASSAIEGAESSVSSAVEGAASSAMPNAVTGNNATAAGNGTVPGGNGTGNGTDKDGGAMAVGVGKIGWLVAPAALAFLGFGGGVATLL